VINNRSKINVLTSKLISLGHQSIIRIAMTTISEKIQTIWKSKSDDDKNFSHIISLETQNRLKLSTFICEQERVKKGMFDKYLTTTESYWRPSIE